MGSAFHQLCPRYSGTLTPTAPTAIRLPLKGHLLMAVILFRCFEPKYRVNEKVLTLLHSEQPKLYGVLAVLSAVGLRGTFIKQPVLCVPLDDPLRQV